MSFIAMLMAMVFLADGSSGSKPLEGFMLEKSASVAQSSGMQTGWMKSWLPSFLGLQSISVLVCLIVLLTLATGRFMFRIL